MLSCIIRASPRLYGCKSWDATITKVVDQASDRILVRTRRLSQ